MSSTISSPVNRLILGDNLEIMKRRESESVDLFYLDPPFFSNKNYEVIWGDAGEIRSFKDRWAGGIEHYVAWLKERVELMHRLLKKTGSIFLHCDWHADAYIRVDILDKIFGQANFINEFVWKRSSNRSSISKAARKCHDTIFYYSKSKKYIFNQIFLELSETSKELYKHKDKRGYFQAVPLLVSGKRKGETGKTWKGIDPNKQGKEGMHWVTTPAKLDEYEKQGLVYFPPQGNTPRLKYYLEQSPGVPLSDVWDDIKLVQGSEAIGYPTQKPEALMERIIKCASNEGDLVLDPFMGGGTTMAVAEKLNRRWIGIDQSVQAVKVSELRIGKQRNLFKKDILSTFSTELYKYDYDTLRYKDAFEFEDWIIRQYGGMPHGKKGGDKGIDGKTAEGVPIQVKRSDNVSRDIIDKFPTAAKRYDQSLFQKNVKNKKPIGYVIAFSFGKGAVEEVARLRVKENIIIELITVDKIVPIAMKPTVTVTMRELSRDAKGNTQIEFSAEGHSEAGIEFYAWDFEHDEKKGFVPFIVIDKSGKQTHTFSAGMHVIAVKVVDNEGLESFETIKLKVNGVVKKLSSNNI